MSIKIGAFGYGLGAIFGAGAVLLAVLGSSLWSYFLAAAVIIWILSVIARKI